MTPIRFILLRVFVAVNLGIRVSGSPFAPAPAIQFGVRNRCHPPPLPGQATPVIDIRAFCPRLRHGIEDSQGQQADTARRPARTRTGPVRTHRKGLTNMNPNAAPKGMTLTSPGFIEGQTLRRTYTADGADVSPALRWSQAPPGTKSFAIIFRDVDAPGGTFIHWLIYNIPGTASGAPEAVPRRERLDDGSVQGTNDFQAIGYNGPRPPPGRPHNYHLELYALDTLLPAESGINAARLMDLMKGHILVTARLMGSYRR